jgi:hypothetical protein
MSRERNIHEENEERQRILVGIPEGKMALGIPNCGWEDNIRRKY